MLFRESLGEVQGVFLKFNGPVLMYTLNASRYVITTAVFSLPLVALNLPSSKPVLFMMHIYSFKVELLYGCFLMVAALMHPAFEILLHLAIGRGGSSKRFRRHCVASEFKH